MRRFLILTQLMTPVTIALILAVSPVRAEPAVTTPWGVVNEPLYPSHICATLAAALHSVKGSIDTYDADGVHTEPDKERIQSAINTCSNGAVKLILGVNNEDGFLTGPLILKSGVTLWIDRGVTLFASRDPRDYDTGAGDCGTANRSLKKSCRSLIEGQNISQSGLVGDGKIDGRGGSLLLSGPNKGLRSWWDVAWQSKQGLMQHNFRLVQIDGGDDLTFYRLTFENSPNFHIVPNGITGLTVWGIKILSPSLSYTQPGYACPDKTTPDRLTPATCFTPDTVKNTDGFDPGNSKDVLLAYSYLSTGDDNVAIKSGGKGGGSHHQVYAHNWFYYGHGMSVGSETDSGIDDISVTDLTLDGMDSSNGNGLRIKSDASRGGRVRQIIYDGICMKNEIRPIVIDTHYSDNGGLLFPDFQNIVIRNFHALGSVKVGNGTLTFRGFRSGAISLPITIDMDKVTFDGTPPNFSTGHRKPDGRAEAVHFQIGSADMQFAKIIPVSPVDDVTVNLVEGRAPASSRDCTHAFLPLKSVLSDSPF